MAKRVEQFRIFLSSPGDVQAERDIARELIKDVLPYSPFIRGRATFDVVSWDDPHAAPGLDAHLTPQEAINRQLPKPSECDIVIVILWSRMGTPMPSDYTKEDGSTYQSGTEWEYDDAASGGGRTLTLLYRRTEEPMIGARDPEAQEKLEQVRKVDGFFERFQDADGSLSGSFTTYETVDEFRKRLRQNLESVVARLLGDVFSEELGVTKAAVDSMMAILKEQEVPAEQLEAKLKEIAERHLELTEKLHQLSTSNDEPEVAKRREQAAEAIKQGEYDRAEALLAEAVAIDRSAIDEQQEVLDRRKLSAAATISQLGDLERIRLKYRRAAKLYDEATMLLPEEKTEVHLAYLEKQAAVLRAHGQEFGESSALAQAIEIYQIILKGTCRQSMPSVWAHAQVELGGAFRNLGRREGDSKKFAQAAEAFEAALEVRSRQNMPIEWARTQLHLGITFQRIGEQELNSKELERATEAFRSALEEVTQERTPLDWAVIQDNLGTALRSLGERQCTTDLLKKSIDAFELALEERTRERVPLAWAGTMHSLGVSLTILEEREDSPQRLERAIDAFRAALEERTRERVPLDWAMSESHLGNIFRILGTRQNDMGVLENAIKRHELSLQELTQERAPIFWAWVQYHLGLTQCAIGKKSDNELFLRQGDQAFKLALSVFKERQHKFAIVLVEKALANVKALLQEL